MSNKSNLGWAWQVKPADHYTQDEIIDMFARVGNNTLVHDVLMDHLWPIPPTPGHGRTQPYSKRLVYSVINANHEGARRKQRTYPLDLA